MYVLGIETSCDETSAAVVKDGKTVLSNVVSSSLDFHAKYGGVVPEIASRKQLEVISQVTDRALKNSAIKRKDISLVSVASHPGLFGSLAVGIAFGRALSLGLNVPLVEVDHIYSHIYANFLSEKNIQLPFVALVVSGGHTSLFYVKSFAKIKLLGATQDDAAGEAFDKVAKILGLGYPGGPLIEKLAVKGNPRKIRFRCSGTKKPFNFSFSGIKTAVLYYMKNSQPPTPNSKLKSDVAASFQEAVINSLIEKSLAVCKVKRVKTLLIGGGVAANNRLREEFSASAKAYGIRVLFPAKQLCMDNAAMVAGLGYKLFKQGG